MISVVSTLYNNLRYRNLDATKVSTYLQERNQFYSISKTVEELVEDVCLAEEYAFYCGDGLQKTQQGKYIEDLVDDENIQSC